MFTKDILRACEEERCAALISGEIAQLRAIVDTRLHWGHSSGGRDDYESFLRRLEEGRTRYLEIRLVDEVLTPIGNTGLCTGIAEMRVVVSGQEHEVRNRYLNVWVEEDGAFKLVAWQSTSLKS